MDNFIIGADTLAYLSPVRHPMIMVDRIKSYHSDPLALVTERFVSANEPVFVGHFPNLKLWPGIYTIEGLRQTCNLLLILRELDKADLLNGVVEINNRQMLRPQINHKLCQSVIDFLDHRITSDPDLFSVSIKLLEPVFAGSLIEYHCFMDDQNSYCCSVEALVDNRLIAKGMVMQSSNAR
jgi:3-hydroxymyristoyl/3-hydroxydecanoyl-(acyl carrier protein) dehydratase